MKKVTLIPIFVGVFICFTSAHSATADGSFDATITNVCGITMNDASGVIGLDDTLSGDGVQLTAYDNFDATTTLNLGAVTTLDSVLTNLFSTTGLDSGDTIAYTLTGAGRVDGYLTSTDFSTGGTVINKNEPLDVEVTIPFSNQEIPYGDINITTTFVVICGS
ncbi:hypothetical protein [Shewanella subflava]|uniref:Uncharacterized protein n=1 Tax=Shewanella subflava TaxID=2986476 RepID=A0ABT3I9D9_9GAMM|nr:hypothetical protein [Shewanella subflava]MCW3172633.1 hypothetical protein [Shewanella subflava]